MNIEKFAIAVLTLVIAVLLGISIIFSDEDRDSLPIRGDKGDALESRAASRGPNEGGRVANLDDGRAWKLVTRDTPKKEPKVKAAGSGKSVSIDIEPSEDRNVIPSETRVERRETFSHIAKRVWNDASLYHLLVKANPELDPKTLREGDIVKVPERRARRGAKQDSKRRSKKAAADTSEKRASRTHTVASNETLSSISARYYQSSNKWRRIFEANRDRLKDPNDVRKGVTLRIP